LTPDALERFAFTEPHLGTHVRLVLYAPNAVQAERAASNAFARVRALDAVLSDYKDDSELRRLGRSTGSTEVGPDLWAVLSNAQNVSRASGGAFDVTVGPLVMMWRQARISGRLPPKTVLEKRLAVVGWEKLKLAKAGGDRIGGTVTPPPRTRLDVGGIAKGYIADRVLASLAADGCVHAMVDAGGDLALGLAPPGKEGWRVVVERPSAQGEGEGEDEGEGEGKGEDVLELASCGVASSGATYQFLELGGTRYSHIVDPRTGLGTTHGWQVTVTAPNAMLADAWASAFSVLGRDAAARLNTVPKAVTPLWQQPAQDPAQDPALPSAPPPVPASAPPGASEKP